MALSKLDFAILMLDGLEMSADLDTATHYFNESIEAVRALFQDKLDEIRTNDKEHSYVEL